MTHPIESFADSLEALRVTRSSQPLTARALAPFAVLGAASALLFFLAPWGAA